MKHGLTIGGRLELFVDRYLIGKLDGPELCMHAPQRMSRPEASLPGWYATVIKDGDLYRGYYRDYVPGYDGPMYDGNEGEITCCAESRDGHEWRYPEYGVSEVSGPNGGNVILAGQVPFSHNFSPLLDPRPDVPADQRYKALSGRHWNGDGYAEGVRYGVYPFTSPDGIHWKRACDEAVLDMEEFGFDSQTAAFWSNEEGRYVCYFRTWKTPHGELRSISRTTSTDFISWSTPVAMNPNLPGEHLYTSNTHPYFRAPHIYVSLPTRFFPDRGDSTDILFMATRAGTESYTRLFTEAFIRPGLDLARWGDRSNYVALNVVPTGPAEMSIYHTSGHRYVLRTDGFVSVRAGVAQGEMLTKPLTFSGDSLVVNCSTSGAGSLQVEIQDAAGEPVPGFTLGDCPPFAGDKIEHRVQWEGGPDLAALSGTPVRLRFVMTECDLYSLQFRDDV